MFLYYFLNKEYISQQHYFKKNFLRVNKNRLIYKILGKEISIFLEKKKATLSISSITTATKNLFS